MNSFLNGLLKKPWINAACISVFSGFYALVFLCAAHSEEFVHSLQTSQATQSAPLFWGGWARFLAGGGLVYLACVLLAFTVALVALLLARRRPYDEYHTVRLLHCLAIALVCALIAIAGFLLLVLHDPTGMLEKFMLFIAVHWTTVVLADWGYVLASRWR